MEFIELEYGVVKETALVLDDGLLVALWACELSTAERAAALRTWPCLVRKDELIAWYPYAAAE